MNKWLKVLQNIFLIAKPKQVANTKIQFDIFCEIILIVSKKKNSSYFTELSSPKNGTVWLRQIKWPGNAFLWNVVTHPKCEGVCPSLHSK